MRRRDILRGIGALGAVAVTGCNRKGSGITGPSGSDTSQPVTVVSGRTGQAIPSLGGLTATRGQALNLQALGFFSLRTAFAGAPILLWPADDGYLTSGHTRRIVYGGKDPGTLTRLARGTAAVSLVPDAGIRAFPWAIARVTKAAQTLSAAHESLEFSVDGGGFPVNLIMDFSDPVFQDRPGVAAAAYTHTDNGGVITQAKVVFRTLQIQGFWHSEDNFETAVVHEVIHTTGLNHSSGAEDPPGIMADDATSYQFRAPGEYERLIMKLQYERLPGTTLAAMTEADPGVSTKSVRTGWHPVCVR